MLFLTEMRRKASPWQRNLGYPLAMLVLLGLTVLTILLMYLHWQYLLLVINMDDFLNCCVFTVHVFLGDVCTDGLF